MRQIDLKKANVAHSDTIRDINRQIVLNYVREKEPISRAEISHETALQRSTVSLIVDELRTRGLIDEIEGESTGGRPPMLLHLRAAGSMAIGVDVFILVLVEEGLGTGIVLDGQVYHGMAGAGEFGHMTIGKGAPGGMRRRQS